MIMQSENFIIKTIICMPNTAVDGTGMFLFDTFNSRVSANVMKKNNRGIYLENAIDNFIEFNMVENNQKGIQYGKNSVRNQINVNNFIGNNQQVISHEESENDFNWDGIGNYWDNHKSIHLSNSKTSEYAFKSGDVFIT